MNAKTLISTSVLAVLSMVLVGGCSKEPDKPKPFEIKGKVLEIDRQTSVVTFEYYNDEGERRERKGTLSPDAEILVNGVTVPMEEVFVGEEVTVRGYVERVGGEPRIVAKTVVVTRDEKGEAIPPAASQPE